MSKIRDTPLMYKTFQYQKLSGTPKGPPHLIFSVTRHFCDTKKISTLYGFPKILSPTMVSARNSKRSTYEIFRYCGTKKMIYGLFKFWLPTDGQRRLSSFKLVAKYFAFQRSNGILSVHHTPGLNDF